jgi:VWFA-related protein
MKKIGTMVLLSFLILSNSCFSRILFAQNQKPEQDQILKLKSELINVRAVVTDKNGKVVEGLNKDDFEVLENKRSQEISFFSFQRTSLPAPGQSSAQASSPVKQEGDKPSAISSQSPSRTIVLFVDNVNLSFSGLALAREELKKFINQQVNEQDLIALVTATGSSGIFEQFTTNQQIILRAIDKIKLWETDTKTDLVTPFLAGRVLSRDRMAQHLMLCIVNAELRRISKGIPSGRGASASDSGGYDCVWSAGKDPIKIPINPEDEALINGRARSILLRSMQKQTITLGSLKSVIERLQGMPGQRMLALFSEGFSLVDTGGKMDPGRLQAVISRATRAGVFIYSFDVRGLKNDDYMTPEIGNFIPPPVFPSFVSSASRDLEQGLNALAVDTGGKALFNSNNLGLGLQKALDENGAYYALDYYSSNETPNDKFREISVQVKTHPEYKVRTQRGYLPGDFKTVEQPLTAQQRLVKAMTASVAATGLGVSASAEYLEMEGDNLQATLSIYADAKTIDYVQQNNLHNFDLEVGIAIFDEAGKIVKTYNEKLKGSLSPDQLNAAKRNGYRYSKRIDLKPGIYNIRVGLLEARTEKIGTAVSWIEIPNLSNGKLALSDLLLVNSAAPNPNGAAASQAVSKHGNKIYKSVDILSYAFKIYNASEEAKLTMQVAFTQNGQPILQTGWVPVTSLMDNKDSKGINVSQQFKLNNLQPGTYELKLQVKDGDRKQTAQTQAPFTIEP